MSKQEYKQNIVRLKELKGIKIYFEDDFYEAFSLVQACQTEPNILNQSARLIRLEIKKVTSK